MKKRLVCAGGWKSGLRFKTGPSEADDLTDSQIHQQCKMYVAALRSPTTLAATPSGFSISRG